LIAWSKAVRGPRLIRLIHFNMMKKALILIVVGVLIYGLEFVQEAGFSIPGLDSKGQGSSNAVEIAYNNQQSDVQLQGVDLTTASYFRIDFDGG
jgi:hypothetical protein